jgi:hypothetical protein
MDDESAAARAMFEALPEVESPEGLDTAPILDGWRLYVSPDGKEVAISGRVSGSEKFTDGQRIWSSALNGVGAGRRFVRTQNSVYRLGWPYCASLDGDAEIVWPPVLRVAALGDLMQAARSALALTGWLSGAGAEVAIEFEREFPDIHSAAANVAEKLRVAGRDKAADAWRLISTDIRHGHLRRKVAQSVRHEAAELNRAKTPAEVSAEAGWKRLSDLADDYVSGLSDLIVDDPIAAAHRFAALMGGKNDGAIPGVIVLKQVGGTSKTSSGKEAVAEFAKVSGIPLPMAPVPDLAAVARVLHAEFPYAAGAISTVLADLAGAEHVRLRPTLLVGEPGSGKSRLVRRLAESLGVGLHRFDGAGSSDNAFGGTPRRWSSGEPCAPVEAVRKFMIANPIVMVDEVEKAGRSRHNGSLQDALIPFLEGETARSYPDPYIQTDVDLSHVSYLLTANAVEYLPSPLKDRLRILTLTRPTAEHLPALCRGIVADIARERGGDARWWPDLDGLELDVAEELWRGGSVRRLRTIVEKLLATREGAPRN